MNKSKNVLVAIDGADPSLGTVRYVADVIGGRKDFTVHLLHVLGPLPPELRSFVALKALYKKYDWNKNSKRSKSSGSRGPRNNLCPYWKKQNQFLRNPGLPPSALETEFWASVDRQDLVNDILEASERHGCGTLVVGRHSFYWLREIFHRHVADQLIRKGRGLTVWVVE